MSLVGTSGCGKSTIAGLLSGKNKGYQGSIQFGGTELSRIPERELMAYITVVTHNSYLWKGTVEENLRMAKPEATAEEMRAATEKSESAGLSGYAAGFETSLTEKAGNPDPAGQKQRLALARALLHDTPVYIFDEATSNIDMESEEMIMEVIRELAKTKTVLLISHRLANVVDSDCIFMLEKAGLRKQGPTGN